MTNPSKSPRVGSVANLRPAVRAPAVTDTTAADEVRRRVVGDCPDCIEDADLDAPEEEDLDEDAELELEEEEDLDEDALELEDDESSSVVALVLVPFLAAAGLWVAKTLIERNAARRRALRPAPRPAATSPLTQNPEDDLARSIAVAWLSRPS